MIIAPIIIEKKSWIYLKRIPLIGTWIINSSIILWMCDKQEQKYSNCIQKKE